MSFVCLAVLTSAVCARAATITKANNTDNLNLTTSWTNGVVPIKGRKAYFEYVYRGMNRRPLIFQRYLDDTSPPTWSSGDLTNAEASDPRGRAPIRKD
jgi:hypothetical protein